MSERFVEAARVWADERVLDPEEALAEKTEQALLEVEHLVSGATEVGYALDDRTVRFEPTDDLEQFLADRAAETGLEPATVLELYVELFAGAFLEDEGVGPGGP